MGSRPVCCAGAIDYWQECRDRSIPETTAPAGGVEKRRNPERTGAAAAPCPAEHLTIRLAPLTGWNPLSLRGAAVAILLPGSWPEITDDAHGRISSFDHETPTSRSVTRGHRNGAYVVDVVAATRPGLQQSCDVDDRFDCPDRVAVGVVHSEDAGHGRSPLVGSTLNRFIITEWFAPRYGPPTQWAPPGSVGARYRRRTAVPCRQ